MSKSNDRKLRKGFPIIPTEVARAAYRRIDTAEQAGASPEELERLAKVEYERMITEPVCDSCRKPFDVSGFVGFVTPSGIVYIHPDKTCRTVWENQQNEETDR